MTFAAEPLRALYCPLAHPEDELRLKRLVLYGDALRESLVPWKASTRRLLLAEGGEVPELVEACAGPEVGVAAEPAAAVYEDLFGTPATGARPSATSERVFHGWSMPAALQRASDAVAGDFASDSAGGQTASQTQLCRPS